MKDDRLISTQEILDRTDIAAAKTLTRWHQRGLIPPPQIRTHPGGRGKMAYWPEWVLHRCIKIRALVKAKRKLDEIKQLLGDDWENEAQVPRRRYRFSEVSRRMEYNAARMNLADLVWKKCSPLFDRLRSDISIVSSPLDKQLQQRSIITKAIEMVAAGISPVIVFDGEQLHLVPDFLISQMLADSVDGGTAQIVVPIHRDVRDAFHAIMPELPDRPTVTPVQRVREERAEQSVEREFCLTAPFEYEMGRQRKIRKLSGV